MTTEQRTTIEPRDIVAIELGCATCGSRISYPVMKMQADHFRARQHSCPSCKERLLDSPEANRVAELVEALQTLINGQTSALRLEVKDPK